MTSPIYNATEAGHALGITRKGVVSAVLRGSLKPKWHTKGGIPLFDDAALDAYRKDYLGRLGPKKGDR